MSEPTPEQLEAAFRPRWNKTVRGIPQHLAVRYPQGHPRAGRVMERIFADDEATAWEIYAAREKEAADKAKKDAAAEAAEAEAQRKRIEDAKASTGQADSKAQSNEKPPGGSTNKSPTKDDEPQKGSES